MILRILYDMFKYIFNSGSDKVFVASISINQYIQWNVLDSKLVDIDKSHTQADRRQPTNKSVWGECDQCVA